jgi:hypothetical protein
VLGGAEIESITGQLAAGDDSLLTWFIVGYTDGDEEHREGTLLDASVLAHAAGLTIVPTTRAGSFQWLREPIRAPDTSNAPPVAAPNDAQA